MKASKELTLPQAYDPSLNTPVLQDTSVQDDQNTSDEANKNESKSYICDHTILPIDSKVNITFLILNS
jgi:hypothetical protein